MPIEFSNGRLFVGYSGDDWSKVWCDIGEHVNAEGEAELLYYRRKVGPAGYREPMDGEVKYLPQFDWKNCEAETKGEKKRLQKRIVADMIKYLGENDPEEVMAKEDDFNERTSPRFQSCFKEAKSQKTARMKKRAAARRRRTEKARRDGKSEEAIQEEVNSDSSDSAYESEEEERMTRRSTASMPPPPRPNKRTNGMGTAAAAKRGGKKQKMNDTFDAFSFLMNGGYDQPYENQTSSDKAASGVNASIPQELMDEDDNDSNMDARDPTTPQPTFPTMGQTWDWANLSPASVQKVVGRSPGTSSLHSLHPRHGDGVQMRAGRHTREQSDLGLSDEDALKLAMRQSMEPITAEEDGHVEESIEEDGDNP